MINNFFFSAVLCTFDKMILQHLFIGKYLLFQFPKVYLLECSRFYIEFSKVDE